LEKLQKTHAKKVSSKNPWQKNGVFDFYYCIQKFSAYNFFWVNFFAFFSTNSNSASNF
jgi:hypothetical protein